MPPATVLTIGTFDAVHVGHAALVRRARALADATPDGGSVIVLAFDPHPISSLDPDRTPPRLTTFSQRESLLKAIGADEVIRLVPDVQTLSMSPRQFVESLVHQYMPAWIVEGDDFRFGRAREGDPVLLRQLGAEFGFSVHIQPDESIALTDQTIVKASSSIVRWLVGHGRVRDAAAVLGRPYELHGLVVQGDRRGREIGFPTANLETSSLLPADGVYAGRAVFGDSRTMPAAIHVGARATFNDVRRTVEAHIVNWSGPIAEGNPEYGWPLALQFTSYLRDQAKFETVDDLVAQIKRDVGRALTLLAASPDVRQSYIPEGACA